MSQSFQWETDARRWASSESALYRSWIAVARLLDGTFRVVYRIMERDEYPEVPSGASLVAIYGPEGWEV